MTTPLTLQVTGPFRALDQDGRAIGDLSRRGQAILAFLTTQTDMSAPRSVLTALIWGDRGEDQARASLRQELSQLRKMLPPETLSSSRSAIWLEQDVVDIDDSNSAPFLEGFDLRASDFEDWLRDARQSSAFGRRDALLGHGQLALRDGDAESAASAARTALKLDSTSETAMQLLLRAAAHLEDRAGVIAEFGRFRDRLQRDLDVEPASATLDLSEALKNPVARPLDHATRQSTWTHMRPVLAVMPFQEITAGTEDMFADGIVEEITSNLSRAHEFHIIARQSTQAVHGEALDHAETGKRLGADYLVEGSVRRSGDRVRIGVQLVEVSSGRAIWSERFDDRMDDLFDLQDRIAEAVGSAVAPSLRSAEIHRARHQRETDRSVYELVLTSYPHVWRHKREDNERAIKILATALELDPNYPAALGMKAWCHAGQCAYFWTRDPEADRAAAKALVSRAIAETLDDAPTLVACAAATSMVSADLALAKDLNSRALWLDPNNAWGWTQAGWIANYSQDPDTAIANFERAERLSPLDPFRFMIMFGKAGAMVKKRDYPAAIELVTEGIRVTPDASWAYRMLAAIHTLAGDEAAARAAAAKLHAAFPNLTVDYVRACLPPTWGDMEPRWVESMLAAGIARS